MTTRFVDPVQAPAFIGAFGLGTFSGTVASNTATAGRGNVFFVDGDDGTDGNDGLSPDYPKATIQAALDMVQSGGVVYVKARAIAAAGADPVSYAETLTIAAGKSGVALVGVSSGLKQAAQPQVKKGSGSTAQLTIRSPGCLIYGLTFNGAGATGGGILLDDDSVTVSAEGTIIQSCFFKNCKGSVATDGSKGGGVVCNGGSWNTLIKDCQFYNNIGGVVLTAGGAVTQDITIENCTFNASAAANRDCDIWMNSAVAGTGIIIRDCMFGIFPNAGTKNTYMDLTGVSGTLAGCRFGCTGKTFGAAGNVLVPATVLMPGNWQEDAIITRT